MAGRVLYVDFACAPGANPSADAPEQLHALLVDRVVAWLERYALQDDAMGWVDGYYGDAVAYARRADAWGVVGGRLAFHFPDFAGLHALGAIAFSHLWELSLAVLSPYLDAEARGLGLTITTAFRSPVSIARTTTPLVCLRDSLCWIEHDDDGVVLLSRDDLPRRRLGMLDDVERERVARALATGACRCPACMFVLPARFGGADPFGGSMDWGLSEGGALLAAGDWAGARRELLTGALAGAPWTGVPYELQLACTYALEGDRDGALRFARRALDEGLDDPSYVARDDDLASLRGAELDAWIFASTPAPEGRAARGRATPITRVAPQLVGPLGPLARAAGAALRDADPRPRALATELLLLRDELRSRGLDPPIDELALACMALPPGETLADLAPTFAWALDDDASLSVVDAASVELRITGDGRVVELRPGAEPTPIARLTPHETARLFADARDAHLDRTPGTGDLDEPPDPCGGPPPPELVRWRPCGGAAIERAVVGGQERELPTLHALWHHAHAIVAWARYRDAPGAAAPARSPIFTMAEQRARTMAALARTAGGEPDVAISWQRAPAHGPRVWTTVDAGFVRDHTRDDATGLSRTDLVGVVGPDAVVRAAKALVAAGFPSCGAPDAQPRAVGVTPPGHVALRVWGDHHVPVEVWFEPGAAARHPALAAVLATLDAVRGGARPRAAARHALTLPASASRGHDAPWSMPLHLLVIGSVTGRPQSVPLDDVVPLRIDAATLDATRAALAPSPAADAMWAGLRALADAARASGRSDVVLHALDAGVDDLRSDADDAPTAARSGVFAQLVTRHLASSGGVPIDACLLADDATAADASLVRSLGVCADWGPTQLFGRVPSSVAHRGHRVVDADPFAAGRALIEAFARDGLFREIDGLDVDVAVAFRGARLARHLSPVQLSASATHRGFERVERRAKAWLASQTGFGKPLSKVMLTEEDDQLASSAIEYTLSATYLGGAEGRARFLLHLGGPLGDDPPPRVLIAEAIAASLRGGPRVHAVACGERVWTPEGVLVEGGVPRGPVAGEAWHRLSEALLALLDEPPAARGDELTVAVGAHRVVARVAARHPVATRLAEARASVDRWADATTLDLSGRAADEAALVARVERAIGVQRLLLGSTGATDAVVRAIVDSDRLATVEALDLHDNPEITDASVVVLVSSPAARKLRHLSLGWTSVTRATARAILDSPLVDALAWLDLRRTWIHVDAEDWVDQGAVIGNTPRDDEVDDLVARFGARVLLR